MPDELRIKLLSQDHGRVKSASVGHKVRTVVRSGDLHGFEHALNHGCFSCHLSKYLAHGSHLDNSIRFGDLTCQSKEKAHLDCKPNLALIILIHMGRRGVPLCLCKLYVAVNKNAIPWDSDVI